MRDHLKELEIYPQLMRVKEEFFSCFKSVRSPLALPDIMEQIIVADENDENTECVIAFCKEYEGLYYECLSLRGDEDDGYIIIWYKSFEGLELRDRVRCGHLK